MLIRMMRKRRELYESTGSSLIAFATSQRFVTRLLRHKALGPYRCYMFSAGSGLRSLCEACPATQASDQLRRFVVSGLKLKFRLGDRGRCAGR